MINVTEHFATDIQEFKASTTERVDKIEHLLLENIMEYETVKKKRKKKRWNNQQSCYKMKVRLEMEAEYLLKVIELLSVQQINTRETNGNT